MNGGLPPTPVHRRSFDILDAPVRGKALPGLQVFSCCSGELPMYNSGADIEEDREEGERALVPVEGKANSCLQELGFKAILSI